VNTALKSAAQLLSYRDVWLLSGGHCFTHWYPATFFILLPILGKELGLSYTEIGFIMTVQYLAGALTNLPGGMLVDAVGKKGYLMAVSLFWVGVPYALMALTHNYWMLLACVALVGIGNNLWHPTAIPTLANRYPDRKGLILALHGMGGNVGEAVAPLFIGLLLTYMSWRAAVIVNIIPGAIMATLILVMLGAFAASYNTGKSADAHPAKLSAGEYWRGTLGLLRNRGLMLISISSGFRIMTQIGLLTFLPAYLAYELGYSPWAVGLAMALLQIAGFIATPVGGHLSDKMGRKKVVMASFGMTAILIVAMALAGRTPAFIFMVAILGFFLYATRAVIQAWTIEETPKHLAATGIGVVFTLQGLGGAVSPTIFGLIADTYDIFTAFYFLAGTIVVANCLIVFMPNHGMAQARPAAATR
jgi:MFS family permease